MSTNYPTSLDSYTTKTDNVTTVLAAHVNDLQAAVVAIETLVGAGAGKPAAAATASTIVLRDASAGASFAALATTTIAASGAITLSNAAPGLFLYESDAAADNRYWDIAVNTKVLYLRVLNDALNGAANAIVITRGSGVAVSDIALAATTLNLTGAVTVTGAASVSGALTAPAGALLPKSGTAASLFAVDASGTGSAVTLANGAAAYVFGNSNVFSGLIIVTETATDKSSAMFLIGAGTSGVSSDPSGHYAAADTGSKSCVYVVSNAVVIKNNRGGSRTYNIFSVRLNTSN